MKKAVLIMGSLICLAGTVHAVDTYRKLNVGEFCKALEQSAQRKGKEFSYVDCVKQEAVRNKLMGILPGDRTYNPLVGLDLDELDKNN